MAYISKYNDTHIYIAIYRAPIPSPKFECRQPDSPAATGGTISCHNDNGKQAAKIDDPPSSMVMDE